MPVTIIKTRIPDVVIIEPAVFRDKRGFFLETYNKNMLLKNGLDVTFVQDNHSHSERGTLRGLHYQLMYPQAKLVFVVRGAVFDVAVDIRRGSPTFGTWIGEVLSEENKRQMYIPEGFAHGFCVLSDSADFMYKCTDFYHPEDDRGINWNDPSLGVTWPITGPTLSEKDTGLPLLEEISPDLLFSYDVA